MENEQEEINTEIDLNQNNGVINLPDVENEETIDEVEETNSTEEKVVDEEKESLKRGVNKERELRKNAEKKAKELESRIKALEEKNQEPQKTIEEELAEQGVDENVAKSIAKAIEKKQSGNSDLAKELAEVKFENALTKKSKEKGFEDILDYADEVKDLVDKGLTIEQSYYATTYNKSKTKDTKSEIERKFEAKMQNNNARKEILGNYNNSSSAVQNSNSKINVTPEEKALAAMAGMTVNDYVAIRDAKDVKDYNKYKSKKVK